MNFKLRKCKVSGHEWKQYNSLQKCPCTDCREKQLKPKIKPVSDKKKKEDAIYQLERVLFLKAPENKKCAIQGTYCLGNANTIEHIMGRVGYADGWARENKITLYLDKRFWKPACINCNLELENNPELSRKHQLSKIHGGTKINKSRE